MYSNTCIQCGVVFPSKYKNRAYCSDYCCKVFTGNVKIKKEKTTKRLIITPSGLEVVDNIIGKYMSEGTTIINTIKPVVSRTLFRYKKHGGQL